MAYRFGKLICLLFISVSFAGYGQQTRLSADMEQFPEQLQQLMKQASRPDDADPTLEFQRLWEGRWTNDEKDNIMAIAQKMQEKRMKPRPHFQLYLSLLEATTEEQASQQYAIPLVEFLETSLKVVGAENQSVIEQYFQTLQLFIAEGYLYKGAYNQLYAANADAKLSYIEAEVLPDLPELTEDNAEDDTGWFSDWDQPHSQDDDWSSADSWDNSDWEQDEASDSPEIIDDFTSYEEDLPVVQGAVLSLTGVDLMFLSPHDSTGIYKTTGQMMLKNNNFVGEGGQFTWEIAGLAKDTTYVQFEKYAFLISKSRITAENVQLYYLGKINKPVAGVFEYESKKRQNFDDAQFPRFKSYQNNITIDNLGEKGLKYTGGFSLSGRKIYSNALYGDKAELLLVRDNKKLWRAFGKTFSLQDSLINTERSSIIIYHQNDSVYHPAIRFRYEVPTGMLTLLKDEGGFKNTPYYASSYAMDISVDMLQWDTYTDSLDFSTLNARQQLPARFESQEYFNRQRFDNLTGLFDFNPLVMVVGYSRKLNSPSFYSADMAKNFKQNEETMKGAMRFLMENGFVDYNPATDEVKLKRKAYHYMLSKDQKKDFDNLLITSLSAGQPNATLNLETEELKVRGVKKFYISELLDVFIEPKNQEITLLANRDFRFDGNLSAGNFQYVGEKFFFNYDEFLLTLPQIDSIKLQIETEKKDRNNKLIKEKLENQMVHTSGTLFINKPDNKSSRKTFPQYPIFRADKGATVLFDGKSVANGAYDSTMAFTVPPFEIDSISSSDPASIAFEGKFTSNGIFPDLDVRLKVMPDNSLGFEYPISPDGLPIYNGKAIAYDFLKMDGNGLVVDGRIEYLTSSLYSDNFMFYMDSVKAIGSQLAMEPGMLDGTSFPQAELLDYEMAWVPSKDSMYVVNLKAPFQFYDNTASMDGFANINSKGVFASGSLLTRGLEAVSAEMNFQEELFFTRHSEFEIKSSNPKKPALRGSDVRLSFDLIDNDAEISPEVEGVAALDFPYAQVRTSINKATWDLNTKTVSMTKPEDTELTKSYFYSTRQDLDSLAFYATAALYDINELKLNVTGIPYIIVADAKITPENNEVLILENTRIDQLQNAVVVIDTLNEYHTLINGKIDIISRKKFSGQADYQYVNAEADTFIIAFDKFISEQIAISKKQEGFRTVSSGSIRPDDFFEIAPDIFFKGQVTMYADKPALELDGFVNVDLKSLNTQNTWIVYQKDGSSRELAFDFATAQTESGNPLYAGLYWEMDKALYSAFLSEPKTMDDPPFFAPKGKFSFDEVAKQYRIASPTKAKGSKSYEGDLLVFDDNTGEIRYEGKLNYLKPTGKGFDITAAGNGSGNVIENDYKSDNFFILDFDIPSQAVDAMGTDLAEVVTRIGAPSASSDRTRLVYKLAEIIGDKGVKDYEEKSLSGYTPLVGLNNALAKTLVLSDVPLVWSSEHNGWYSKGKLGFSNAGKQDVNAMLDGFMEIRKGNEGDMMNIFLQASASTWYYFSFENDRMFIYSSNKDFNDAINKKSNLSKAKMGDFAFGTSDISEALGFVNRFRKMYFDIDTPYELGMPTDISTEADDFQTISDDDDDDDQAGGF